MGPWTGGRDGEVHRLRLSYRSILGEQAFVAIYAHVSKLELETSASVRGPATDRFAIRWTHVTRKWSGWAQSEI